VDYDRRWEAQTSYRRWYLPAVRAAGLPTGRGGVNFHSLRHSFASLAASRGVAARQVAAWMGHASEIVTVTIYTHLFVADSDAAVAAMAGTGRPERRRPRHRSGAADRPTLPGYRRRRLAPWRPASPL
jgi:integrase